VARPKPSLILDLCNGKPVHRRVLAEGGHGAYLRKALDFQAVDVTIATGPKRRLVEPSKLPITLSFNFGFGLNLGLFSMILNKKSKTWKSQGVFFHVLYCNRTIAGKFSMI
jgi:hypothetical protein